MLETIRQYAEEQLAGTGTIGDIRDRHARYYAKRAVRMWDIWNSPEQRAALDWVDAEFANLRSGFRWATERAELDTAAAVAAHATLLAFALQRLEPVGWAEELVVGFDHIGRPDVAAILYGASQRHAQPPTVVALPAAIQHLRDTLSTQDYDAHVATGHSMSLSDAVRYAREQLGHDPH